MKECNVKVLVGKTLSECKRSSYISHRDVIMFKTSDGLGWAMYHQQECCESVRIEDINGDLSDLVGTPILVAEKVSSHEDSTEDDWDSKTWTFYKFATVKGYVTIRWFGTSNGYYSEGVDFEEVQREYEWDDEFGD